MKKRFFYISVSNPTGTCSLVPDRNIEIELHMKLQHMATPIVDILPTQRQYRFEIYFLINFLLRHTFGKMAEINILQLIEERRVGEKSTPPPLVEENFSKVHSRSARRSRFWLLSKKHLHSLQYFGVRESACNTETSRESKQSISFEAGGEGRGRGESLLQNDRRK